MGAVAEEIVTIFTAQTEQFEAAVKRGASVADISMSNIERSAGKAEASMRKLGPAASVAVDALKSGLATEIGEVATQSIGAEIAVSALSGVLTGGLIGALAAAIPLAIEFGAQLLTSGHSGKEAADGYDAAKAAVDRYNAALKHLRDPGESDVGVLLDKIAQREIEIRTLQARIPTMPGTRGRDTDLRREAVHRVADLQGENARDQELVDAAQLRQAAKVRAEDLEKQKRDEEALARQRERDQDAAERRSQAAIRERQRMEQQLAREAEEAERHRIKAVNDYVEAGRRAGEEGIRDINRSSERGLVEFRKDQEKKQQWALDADEQQRNRQADNIRSLAGLYQTAFTGGAKGIGEALKQELQKAIAVALAKLTIEKLSTLSSSGGILGLIGNFAKGLAPATSGGRASGGYVAAGQLYQVNEAASAGNPEYFRPQESGTVIPLGQTKAVAGGEGTVVHQHFTLDARGGLLLPDLIANVNASINAMGAQAAAAGSSMGQAAISRRQRYRLGS